MKITIMPAQDGKWVLNADGVEHLCHTHNQALSLRQHLLALENEDTYEGYVEPEGLLTSIEE